MTKFTKGIFLHSVHRSLEPHNTLNQLIFETFNVVITAQKLSLHRVLIQLSERPPAHCRTAG